MIGTVNLGLSKANTTSQKIISINQMQLCVYLYIQLLLLLHISNKGQMFKLKKLS